MMGVCYAMYLYIRDVDNMLRGEHTSSSATLAELEALPRPYIDPKYQMQRINIWPSLSPPRTYRQRMFFRNGKCRWPRLYFQQPTNWRRRHSRCVRYVHFLYGYKWACVRRATRKWAGWNVEMATEILDIFYIEIIRIAGIFDLVISCRWLHFTIYSRSRANVRCTCDHDDSERRASSYRQRCHRTVL